MKLGTIDLDTRFEYMIVYKEKSDGTVNTWTLGESGFAVNYESMRQRDDAEILGVYRKLNDKQISDILESQ